MSEGGGTKIRFLPGQDYNGDSSIEFRAWDQTQGVSGGTWNITSGGYGQATAFSVDFETASIAVTAVNDVPAIIVNPALPVNHAPTINAPTTLDTGEGQLTIINGLSIADASTDHTQDIAVTLEATHGLITLGSTTGLYFIQGDGSTDHIQQFAGSLDNVNAALSGLKFIPTVGYEGTAAISIGVNDYGQGGTGGPLSASSTISINVTNSAADNQAPVVTGPSGVQTVNSSPWGHAAIYRRHSYKRLGFRY